MTRQKRDELLDELDELDFRALIDMYHKRCLNEELLDAFVFFEQDEFEMTTIERIERLISHNLITPVEYKGKQVTYFLTNDGVSLAKYQLVHDSRYKTSEIQKHASDLQMSPVIIAHQTALNRFSYNITKWARDNNLAHTYQDQIFAPNLSKSMMTDGLFFLEDEILLLETDTGTENIKDLRVKWTNYSTFLNNPADAYKDKNLKVLFILENVENGQCRRISVFSAIHGMLCSKLGHNFEIYAGTPEELFWMLNKEYVALEKSVVSVLKKNQGFEVQDANFASQQGELEFDSYIYLDGGTEGVLNADGRLQEYLVDFWLDFRASILNKIQYYGTVTRKMNQTLGRTMGYVVVVPNERFIAQLIKKANLDIAENVFFTTEGRLKRNPWHKALFQVNLSQHIYNFENSSLLTPVYQKRVPK